MSDNNRLESATGPKGERDILAELHTAAVPSRKRRPWRIVTWYWKFAYFLVAYFLGGTGLTFAITYGVTQIFGPATASFTDPIGYILVLAMFIVGARVFRGKDEPRDPPRAWWRMTSRRPLSTGLGIIFAISFAIAAAYLVVSLADHRFAASNFEGQVISLVQCGVLAALYLNSSVRMRSLVAPAPLRATVEEQP